MDVPFDEIHLPDTDKWLSFRGEGIGSSEAAAVLNESAYKDCWQLYKEKTGELPPDGSGENKFTRAGRLLEPVIAQIFEEDTGRKLIKLPNITVRRSRQHPFMLATHDYLIEPVDEGGPGVLSVKNTNEFQKHAWDGEEFPTAYQIQLQHEMVVSDCRWGAIIALIGGWDPRIIWVDRNDYFCQTLVDAEAAFWHQVKERIEPATTGSERTARALKRLYAEERPGSAIDLDGHFLRLALERKDLKQQITALNKRVLEIDNEVKRVMKDAEMALLPDGSRFTLKSVVKSYEVNAAYRKLRYTAKKTTTGRKR